MTTDITFESQGQKLVGTLYKAPNEKASVLLLAGGANRPRLEGYYPPWQEYFLSRGITTFNFDFRGVGDAEGNLNKTNLNTRVEDAKAALEILKQNSQTDNIYLLGTSMGGPVAIRTANPSVKGVLLAAPAAYSEEARDKNFGPDFSLAIRKPESWKDSPEFEELKKYNGKTFLLYGDKDEVIPSDLLLTYAEIVKSQNGQVVVLENAGHKSWKDDEREYALEQMANFILS